MTVRRTDGREQQNWNGTMTKTPRPQQGDKQPPAPQQQEATQPPTPQQGQTPILRDWASI